MSSLVQQLQADALDRTIPVADLLRKAKVVASKLALTESHAWIDKELAGYGADEEDLPSCRQVEGEPVAFNPYHGWQVIQGSAEFYAAFGKRSIAKPVGELDDLVSRPGSGEFFAGYPPADKVVIIKSLNWRPHDVAFRFDRSALVGILDAVRNLVLEWSLKLEREGIVGEGLSFSPQEKAKAQEAASTVNIHIQRVGTFAGNVAGSISGQTSVVATQLRASLDIERLKLVLHEIREHVGRLPPELVDPIAEALEGVEQELEKERPDESKIKAGLRSLWRMAEGAAGNLIANGILALLGPFVHGVGA